MNEGWKFEWGDEVYKPKGSEWHGKVVGFYTTQDTPRGYNVQRPAPKDNGAVQIYPEAALELLK